MLPFIKKQMSGHLVVFVGTAVADFVRLFYVSVYWKLGKWGAEFYTAFPVLLGKNHGFRFDGCTLVRLSNKIYSKYFRVAWLDVCFIVRRNALFSNGSRARLVKRNLLTLYFIRRQVQLKPALVINYLISNIVFQLIFLKKSSSNFSISVYFIFLILSTHWWKGKGKVSKKYPRSWRRKM